jgi:protein-S-isoprenylcysteine O-methyltransferase Ste14
MLEKVQKFTIISGARDDSMWVFLFTLGEILLLPIYFLSLEHTKLEKTYGREKGRKIGNALGMLSGWGFFGLWIGIWIAPQPRYTLPLLPTWALSVPFTHFSIPFLHLLLGLLFLLPGAWVGLKSVQELGLTAAETHRSEKIVQSGLYAHVRHPQYLGGLLAHLGITFLLSAWYSLLTTPLMVLLNYLYCWKEETELVREFGEAYETYQKQVPMLIPRLTAYEADTTEMTAQ